VIHLAYTYMTAHFLDSDHISPASDYQSNLSNLPQNREYDQQNDPDTLSRGQTRRRNSFDQQQPDNSDEANTIHLTYTYMTHLTYKYMTHLTYKYMTHLTYKYMTHLTCKYMTHLTYKLVCFCFSLITRYSMYI
jgi:hypothetical protein